MLPYNYLGHVAMPWPLGRPINNELESYLWILKTLKH
jgi:hypothetical protein